MYVIIGAAKIQNPELVNTRSICVVRVIFYHTLLFFTTILLSLSHFFFFPSVSVFTNRVLKKRKKSMFFIGKELSDYLFVECNSSSIHFVCPLSSNQRGCWYLSTSLKWEFKPHLHTTPTPLPPLARILYNYVEYVQNLRTIG